MEVLTVEVLSKTTVSPAAGTAVRLQLAGLLQFVSVPLAPVQTFVEGMTRPSSNSAQGWKKVAGALTLRGDDLKTTAFRNADLRFQLLNMDQLLCCVHCLLFF